MSKMKGFGALALTLMATGGWAAGEALWRPQSSTAVWSSTSWLLDGVLGYCPAGGVAMLDGEEENYLAQIPVGGSQTLARLIIAGEKDYELTGAGKITVPQVEKRGTGVWTVREHTVDAPDEINVKEGVLKIHPEAVDSVLGGAGNITIDAGAAVDVGAGSFGGDFNKNEKTHAKTFNIAGDGPDGQGAIVNSLDVKPDDWNSALSTVHLTANASMGGVHRIDFRPLANSAANPTRPQVTGGDDVTLTIRNQAPGGINFHTTDVALGKIEIADASYMMTEGSSTFAVKNGIEILNGGTLRHWNATVAGANVKVNAGTGNLMPASGTTTYKSGSSFDVAAGATLKQTGGAMFVNEGAMNLAGTFDLPTGNFVQRGALTGDGAIETTGGWLWLSGSIPNQGSTTPKINQTAGGILFGDIGGGAGLPRFAGLDIALSGGALYFVPNASDTLDGGAYADLIARQAELNGNIYFQTLKQGAVLTVKNVKTPEETNLKFIYVGGPESQSRYGNVVFGEGTDLVAQDIRVADGGTKPYPTSVTFAPGSRVKLTGWMYNGNWSGVTTHRHDVLVDGGTLDVVGRLYASYDAPYASFTLKSGEVRCGLLHVNPRWSGFTTASYSHKFEQNGGTLTVGSGGILVGSVGGNDSTETVVAHHEGGLAAIALNHGTLKSSADFGMYCGRLVPFGEFEDHTDPYVIDNENTINWNVGPQGQGDVILRGTGAFNTLADQQAIPFGKWTVEKPAANLRGAAGFPGGLELGEGASAVLKNSADGCVEFGIVDLRLVDLATNVWCNERLPLTTTSMGRLNTIANGSNYHNTYMYRGEFYVTPSQAGRWTFGWCFDDALTFMVDGVTLVNNNNETYTTAKSVVTTLTEGWHRFEIRAWDAYGGFGPKGFETWRDAGLSLGWCADTPVNPLDPAAYQKFDPSTLPMRPWTGLTWRHKKFGTRNKVVEQITPQWRRLPADEYELEQRVEGVKTTLENDDATWKKTYLSESENELTGWFYVPATQAGKWTLRQGFDDHMALMFDGAWVIDNPTYTEPRTSTWTAKTGWHSFKVVWGDTYGGYGTNSQSPSINGVRHPIVVAVNGAAEVPFNEDHFQLGYPNLKPGLGGVTTLQAGSLLTSEGVRYPIYGTLKGTGALAGAFAFAGEASCWEVAGTTRTLTEYVDFSAVTDANPFQGLKKIVVRFDAKPSLPVYPLADAHALTDGEAAAIVVEAYAGDEQKAVPFNAAVKDGKLVLVNQRPNGITLFIR